MSRHTLAGACTAQLDVKKSRFVAHAAPVAAPDDALRWLESVRDPAATHNCWAYRIGQQYRFSDDGEPGGTAGKPILAAIDGSGLDGVVAVVIRWYGGIKLGAGGLVRAYGGAAAECLRTAPRIALQRLVDVTIACDFALSGSVHALLAQHGAEKTGERYDSEGLELTIRVAEDRADALRAALRDASRGRARWRVA